MNNIKKTVAVLTVAVSMALTGCANTAGGSLTGSSAGDYGIGGGLLGAVAGKLACSAMKGSKGQCNNIALAGAAAGAYAGYQQGKTMDEARARQLQEQAMRESGLQMQLKYAQQQVQVQTPQGPQIQQKQVLEGLQLPIAQVDMFKGRTNSLSEKAVRNITYLSNFAQQQNMEMLVVVPSSRVQFAPAIQAYAPNAQLVQTNDTNQYIIIVKPRQQ